MATTMSIICLVENKYSDQKSGAEYGDDAVFRMSITITKNSSGRFSTIHKDEKQCHRFNENDIVHMFGKFTFIKIDRIETIAVCYLSY